MFTDRGGVTLPRIKDAPPRAVASLSSPSTLLCEAEGNPPPHVSWYKDGSPAVSSATHNSWSRVSATRRQVAGALVLSAVTAADAGEWRCRANSSAGVAERTVHLTVTVPLKVQISPTNAQVSVGGRVALRCRVDGHPIDTVTWFKDAEKLRSSSRVRLLTQEELVISPVHAEDAGLYQCRVSSVQLPSAQAASHITLGASAPRLLYRFIAHTLQPGPAVSLKCIARATPTPHIAWTLDGFPLPQSHRYCATHHLDGFPLPQSHRYCATHHLDSFPLPQSHRYCVTHHLDGFPCHSHTGTVPHTTWTPSPCHNHAGTVPHIVWLASLCHVTHYTGTAPHVAFSSQDHKNTR
ncbi:Immunoglobulin I-set [Trinorchestia longiramus]|nr:Immunoglobulin I-set [Trinorchestia longiramus]